MDDSIYKALNIKIQIAERFRRLSHKLDMKQSEVLEMLMDRYEETEDCAFM